MLKYNKKNKGELTIVADTSNFDEESFFRLHKKTNLDYTTYNSGFDDEYGTYYSKALFHQKVVVYSIAVMMFISLCAFLYFNLYM